MKRAFCSKSNIRSEHIYVVLYSYNCFVQTLKLEVFDMSDDFLLSKELA